MQTYLKTRPVWSQLLLFLGMAFGLFIALSYIGGEILSAVTGISFLEYGQPETWRTYNPALITFIRGMTFIQFLALFLIPSLLFAYFSDPEPATYLGLRRPHHAFYWIVGVLVMLAAFPLVEYTGQLNRQVNIGGETQRWIQGMEESALKQIQYMFSRRNSTELVLNLFFIAVLAGIGEEFFFRGILQRLFIRATRRPMLGIVITAFLFSTFHFQFLGFLPRFLMGVILGAIYWYSGSLWVAVLAHFAYNAVQILVAYRNPELAESADAAMFRAEWLIGLVLGSLLLVGAMVWLMIRKSETRYAEVYRDDERPPTDELSF